MVKRITVLSLVLCIICLGSTEIFATSFTEENLSEDYLKISPYMDYISRSSCTLHIDSSGRATTNCSIYGYQGTTTKVSITANLQQYKGGKWTTIKTFTQSSNSHRTSLSETVSITKGYTYRVSAQVKAYSGSSVETRNLISAKSKY